MTVGLLLSKVLGAAREVILAYGFGTSFVVDAFRVAMGAILIPTHLLTGEALFSAFIPAYKRLSPSDRPALIRTVVTTLLISTTLLTIVLIAAAPMVTRIFAPGFHGETAALCSRLIRVAAPGVVLYAVSALLINIQVAHDDYTGFSVRPTVQNLGILGAILAALLFSLPELLGLGFVAAFAVLAVWAAFHSTRYGIRPSMLTRSSFRWPSHATTEFRRALGPISLLVIVMQLSLMVDRIVGSLVGEGAVASLDYAFFVTDSARFLLAVPLATLALGRLGGVRWDEVRTTVDRTVPLLLFGSGIIAALLWTVAEDVVTLLYQRGAFQGNSTAMTTLALRGFAIGLWAAAGGLVLQRVFNATLRNREAAMAAGVALATNLILDLLLYRRFGVFGIAAATSISNVVGLILLAARAGLVTHLVRSTVLPGMLVLLVTFWLSNLEFAMWLHLILASGTLIVVGIAAILLWRPLRADSLWAIDRLRN